MIIGNILGLYCDNGKENENYRDYWGYIGIISGKEYGNYYFPHRSAEVEGLGFSVYGLGFGASGEPETQ